MTGTMTNDATAIAPVPVPRRRRWLVYTLSAGLIVGHGYDVATRGEHWPLSSYPMYADLNPSTFKLVRLWGKTNEDPPRELPIDPAWLRGTIMRIMRRPDAPVRLRRAVEQYAHAYGWDAWAPPGVEFVEYTVYEQVWTLRADADPDRPADSVKLLFQLQRPGAVLPTTAFAPAAAGTAEMTPTSMPATGEVSRDAAR